MNFLLLWIGLGAIVTGSIFTGLSYFRAKRRLVINKKFVATTKNETRTSEGHPYLGVLLPLHYPITYLKITFNEAKGRDVHFTICDYILPFGHGHDVMVYHTLTGARGTYEGSLKPGVYDIHFASTDKEHREIEYEIRGVEITKPYEKLSAIWLTIVTIGFILLTTGILSG